jgi:uncharacterized heparinase superfamily protein
MTRGRQPTGLRSFSGSPTVQVDGAEATMTLSTPAYASRFGVTLERQLTLISEGHTLVGQDRFSKTGTARADAKLQVRFHLAPDAVASRSKDEDIIEIKLKSGQVWKFLWEGGSVSLDDSVRQSAHFGFFKTTQIVMEADMPLDGEVSWILTRGDG